MSDGRNRPQTACRSGRLPDEGAWDFRTTDRLRTPNTGRSLARGFDCQLNELCKSSGNINANHRQAQDDEHRKKLSEGL